MPIVSGNKAKEIEKIMEANYDQEEINKAIEKLNKEFADAPSCGIIGWICPVCGRGLSPYTSSCPCAVKWEITCETGTTFPQHGEIISHIHQDNVSVNTYNNTTPAFKPPREEKYNV